jgi:hypothetical protein
MSVRRQRSLQGTGQSRSTKFGLLGHWWRLRWPEMSNPDREADAMNGEKHGQSLVEFFPNSPQAEAIAAGELSPDAFERERDLPRDITCRTLSRRAPSRSTWMASSANRHAQATRCHEGRAAAGNAK